MKTSHLTFVGLLFFVGMFYLAQGIWIPAKAYVAQLLLEKAWQESLTQHSSVKPWPWADTQPVAKLHNKRLGVSLIVLQGTSGEVLAFGPGYQADSAPIGSAGNSILAGHRDTSFSFLQNLRFGDELEIELLSGEIITYQVKGSRVQLADKIYLEQTNKPWLTLITCYPFDSMIPGQDDRYLVFAEVAST